MTRLCWGIEFLTLAVTKESLQLVLNLERPQERSGVKILPLGGWLDALA